MPGTLTRAGRLYACEAFKPFVGGPDDEFELRLFTNDFAPGLLPDVSDFTEASFGGYSAVAFVNDDNSAAYLLGDEAFVDLKNAPFVWDCASSPQTLIGWYLVRLANDDVIAYDVYGTPHELEVGSRHTLYASIKIGQCG